MCTSMSVSYRDHYFGRNLDLYCHYRECVTISPRQYCFPFCMEEKSDRHFAIIGMAAVTDGYPLYYDAANEWGLCAAGLNFPGNAIYLKPRKDKHNIASYELIPWLLSHCKDLSQARKELNNVQIIDQGFSKELPPSPLHWMISDKSGSIVVEPTADGTRVYENPIGVLTNTPPFPYHMQRLCDYMPLSSNDPRNTFGNNLPLDTYSLGMGAIGLPGDLSSVSRFIRGAFMRNNTVIPAVEEDCVGQFFHLLDTVAQQKGCVRHDNKIHYTVYSCCINANKGIYYYTTYENRQIHAINLRKENLDQAELITFPLCRSERIQYQN